MGNMASTRHLIKETAACYFNGYFIGVYWRADRYPAVDFKANISRYQEGADVYSASLFSMEKMKGQFRSYNTNIAQQEKKSIKKDERSKCSFRPGHGSSMPLVVSGISFCLHLLHQN